MYATSRNLGIGARKVKTIHENVVDAFERDVLDSAVPNDLWYEIHGRSDDISAGRHFEHTTDTPGIELLAFCSRSLDEEGGNRPRDLDRGRRYASEGGDAGF